MSDEAVGKLGQQIPLAEAARRAKMDLCTFRRRMYRLNQIADGKLLVPRGDGQRRQHFSVDAGVLKWLIENAPIEQDHELEALRLLVGDLKKELDAEKRKRITFERTVRRWFFGSRKSTQEHARAPLSDL